MQKICEKMWKKFMKYWQKICKKDVKKRCEKIANNL